MVKTLVHISRVEDTSDSYDIRHYDVKKMEPGRHIITLKKKELNAALKFDIDETLDKEVLGKKIKSYVGYLEIK